MKHLFRTLVVGVIFFALCVGAFYVPVAFEIDSYTLPIISLQYRGSILMEAEDLERAKEDLPEFYQGVSQFADLRASKLVPVPNGTILTREEVEALPKYAQFPKDKRYEIYQKSREYLEAANESKWMAYYFPVYSAVCLPIKLLLQVAGMKQYMCFSLTNAVLYAIGLLWLLYLAEREDKKWYLMLVFSMMGPAWAYIWYISAESLLYLTVLGTMICWQRKKYRSAALWVSIGSMMNPTVMALGIVMFAEYALRSLREQGKEFFTTKKNWKYTLTLCAMYIPSLIPFIVNLSLLGVLNPTMGMMAGSEQVQNGSDVFYNMTDSIFERMLAYLFDLDLGLFSVSALLVLCFLAVPVIAICRKKGRLLAYWGAVLFTIFGFSLATHINCGMMNVSRYVVWIYPAVVLIVCEGVLALFGLRLWIYLSTGVIAASILIMMLLNGQYYSWLDHSPVMTYLLDHYPALAWNPCKSTFYFRTVGDSDCFQTIEPAIYTDTKSGAVRKILFYNDEQTRDLLQEILQPDQGVSMNAIMEQIAKKPENQLVYVTIDCHDSNQYFVDEEYKTGYFRWIRSTARKNYQFVSVEDAWIYSRRICEADQTVAQELYDVLYYEGINDWSYVKRLYQDVLHREPSFTELYVRTIMNETDREGYLWEFLCCEEYAAKNRIDLDMRDEDELNKRREEEEAAEKQKEEEKLQSSTTSETKRQAALEEAMQAYLSESEWTEMQSILDYKQSMKLLQFLREEEEEAPF